MKWDLLIKTDEDDECYSIEELYQAFKERLNKELPRKQSYMEILYK